MTQDAAGAAFDGTPDVFDSNYFTALLAADPRTFFADRPTTPRNPIYFDTIEGGKYSALRRRMLPKSV